MIKSIPIVPKWSELHALLKRGLDLLWLSKKDAREVCEILVKKINKLLAEIKANYKKAKGG